MTTSTDAKQQPQPSEEQIVGVFKQMRAELQRLAIKIGDLEMEKEEHRLVSETLEPLEKSRKCWRLMNGVLVERSVAEVLPSLKENQTNISTLLDRLVKTYKEKDKEVNEYQQKYKIKINQGPPPQQ
eukprot:Partr_v1_DN28871_c0_g1_i1_m33287 putative prefoldin subunit 2